MMKSAAAIDIGTSKIAVVAGRLEERGLLTVTGAGLQGYAGFVDDEWLDMGSLEEAVLGARKAAEKQAGRRIRDVYVSVPGEFIHLSLNHAEVRVAARDHVISHGDIDRLIAESGNFDHPAGYVPLHRTPIAYLADGQTRSKTPLGDQAMHLEGFVSHVMANETFIQETCRILSSLGLGILGFVAGPVATGHLVRTDSESRRTAVVIDAGHHSMDIIVAEGDGLVHHENLPYGGGAITRDLAVALGLTPEQAEEVKRSLVLGVNRQSVLAERRDELALAAQEIAESRVWDMGKRIGSSLDKLGLSWDNQTGLYLTGGGLGMMRGAKDILSSCLGRIVKPYAHQSPLLLGSGYTGGVATLNYALAMNRTTTIRDIIGRIRDLF